MTADTKLELAGVRLRDYIQIFDDALPRAFCAEMIAAFEGLAGHQQRNGRGKRAGLEGSAWTELNVTRLSDAGFQAFFRAQIDKHLKLYNERVRLTIGVPPSARIEDLRIKRYSAESGDRFEPHFDALGEAARRYLVFLWYLNDVDDGGETEFVDLGERIEARCGRLVVFPPYWMFQHAGRPPRSGDKYIVSTYLTF